MELEIGVGIPEKDAQKVLKSALSAFNQRGLNQEHYRAEISRVGSDVFVSFIDKNHRSQRGSRGNPGKIPGFEVMVDSSSFEVRSSQFIR